MSCKGTGRSIRLIEPRSGSSYVVRAFVHVAFAATANGERDLGGSAQSAVAQEMRIGADHGAAHADTAFVAADRGY